jgi:hypothetical protein
MYFQPQFQENFTSTFIEANGNGAVAEIHAAGYDPA